MSSAVVALLMVVIPGLLLADIKPSHMGPQVDGHFRKVVLDSDKEMDGKLDDTLVDPMELSVARDGRVFFAQRDGTVKVWSPATGKTEIAGNLNVFTGLEDGLLGIALDPNFDVNGWMYLFYSDPETRLDSDGKKAGENRVARFTFRDQMLDLNSEKILLRIPTQREQCCHSGGSLQFDGEGNLYISTGDNTNPFHDKSQPKGRNGFGPIDERPGRAPWDAQKSAANPNDLRGKILRIHPEPDGGYTIPKGNLFAPGTEGTRPEIYVMGCRNPFRISVDVRSGILYWGDVGPDAATASEQFGPAGFDEINQAAQAGNFGWPYFVADNKPYFDFDYETSTQKLRFDVAKPINDSPNNTGIKELPPAQPAFIFYPHTASTRFPSVNGGGGRTAMAGPVYYYQPNIASDHKLPPEFNRTLFIYEWSRNWIVAVKLTDDNKIESMDRFCGNMTFKRPIDIELGPDGCLYVIEYGSNWGNNKDSQIVRIEYTGTEAAGQ